MDVQEIAGLAIADSLGGCLTPAKAAVAQLVGDLQTEIVDFKGNLGISVRALAACC